MTRVFGSRRQPGAFFFLKHQTQNKKRAAEGAVETATAVEIDKGGLRHLLLDDSHKLFGKASAKTAPALPPLPQRRRLLSSSEGAITNKPPNTKFKLLPTPGGLAQRGEPARKRYARKTAARDCAARAGQCGSPVAIDRTGYTDEQIGEMVGKSPGAVRVTLHRVRERLREKMSGANASPAGRSQ